MSRDEVESLIDSAMLSLWMQKQNGRNRDKELMKR